MSELVVYQHKNLKQNYYHDMVMKAICRVPGFDYNYFLYGGGIRGGKTYGALFIFWQLALLFPGSRWFVIREDNPALELTSIPSMEKLIGKKGDNFVWKRSKGDTQVIFNNGSRIFFKSENLQRDKELKEFLGMECNGVLLEQMEALSETMLTRAIERIGSWYIDPMPIPLLLGTFNPSPGWIKKRFYDKHIKGQLEKPWIYVEALPSDNPFVTEDQWKNWANLDEVSQRVMIKGLWSFKVEGNIWAYAFDEERHVLPASDERMKLDRRLPVHLIFDFNVDPMTCLVAQKNDMIWGKVLKEFRIRTSDIFEMCARIKSEFGSIKDGVWIPEYYLIVTGDPSGRNRDGNSKGKKSYVDNIMNELQLGPRQNQFPHSHPSIYNTRILVNSLFARHPKFWISEECLFLIDDLHTVKTDENGDIDKKKIDPLKTHLLDNLRYFCWNYFSKFINM